MKPEEFVPWSAHTAYVCGLATNASCCHAFLEKAMELNPDLTFLKEVGALYKHCGEMWNHDNGNDLEAIGGGFNVTLEALQRGSHRDLYGNDYLINILCDIAHGDCVKFSEYDLEAAAELLRKGYVLKERDRYMAAMPLFTKEQYAAACRLAEDFVAEKMTGILKEMNRLAFDILSAHTPRHLQKQVLAVSSTVRDMNAVGIPVKLLLERKALSTEWNPLEMPGMHIELGE